MKTTGISTAHRFDFTAKAMTRPITITFFGDVHYKAPSQCKRTWKLFCEWAQAQEQILFMGMGDYFDIFSTSERESEGRMHESSRKTFNEMCKDFVADFAKDVAFMKGKTIGLIEGNHYKDIVEGEKRRTTTHLLCDRLQCKYLGVETLTQLATKIGTVNLPQIIYAHHGTGTGRATTEGATITRTARARKIASADIYCMGHDHNLAASKQAPLEYYFNPHTQESEFKDKKIVVVSTGTFLKSRVEGEATYAADSAYIPTPLGWSFVTLYPYRRHNSKGRLELSFHKWVTLAE